MAYLINKKAEKQSEAMLATNKRTSDSQLGLAPAAQGGLQAVLVDAGGTAIGPPFPIHFSVAQAGEVHNEEAVQVQATRTGTVTTLLITRDGMPLADMPLTGSPTVIPGDTLSFDAGAMTISMTGVGDSALSALFASQYVINEEPTLYDD